MRRFWIGPRKRAEHTLIFRRRLRGADRKPIEILGQRGLVVEILDQAPLPRRREIERFDQSCEQRNIAHADGWLGEREMGGGLKPKRDGFGIGCRLVWASKRFDAGLPEFACPV